MRQRGGVVEGLLGLRLVVEVAFEIRDLRGLDERRVDVGRAQADARAEERVHRALRVRGDEDEAARGRGTVARRRRSKRGSGGRDVVPEGASEQVVADLADIGRPAAEGGDAGDRVGGGAARGFDRRTHVRVERLGPRLVDQHHRALGDAVPGEERIVGGGDDIDDGIADSYVVGQTLV